MSDSESDDFMINDGSESDGYVAPKKGAAKKDKSPAKPKAAAKVCPPSL